MRKGRQEKGRGRVEREKEGGRWSERRREKGRTYCPRVMSSQVPAEKT